MVSIVTTIFLFFLVSFPIRPAKADSPFPIREGMRWVYESNDMNQTNLVEGLSKVPTDHGIVYIAILRKSSGEDRVLYRTENQWVECSPEKTNNHLQTCKDPLVTLQWPIAAGDHWSSRGFDFKVVKSEAVSVPYKQYSNAWRVAYTPSESSDPIGEFWFVPEVGQVRIQESQTDFVLTDFTKGEGAELQVSKKEAIERFLEQPQNIPITPASRKPFRSWISYLEQFKFFPLLVFQIVFTTVLVFLGFVAWGVWKSGKAVKEMSLTSDPKEEAKLLGMVAHSGDVQRAEERLKELVHKHPKYPDLRYQLGTVLKMAGKFDEAMAAWGEALRINPKYVDAHLALAHMMVATNDPKSALGHYEIVVQLRSKFMDAWVGIGRCHKLMGNISKAAQIFEQVLATHPHFTEAKQLLSECLNLSQAGEG